PCIPYPCVPIHAPLSFCCRIANLKIQLAKLDSEAWPGVLDSERDRLILINEKEELLKEMRFISPRKWTRGEVERLETERKRLEEDLQTARDTQSKLPPWRIAVCDALTQWNCILFSFHLAD
uniref:WWC1-like helical hairpin domain-containing protein n=1 Tax=Nothoprocta perdicaria TaxID=30464 RepID=A0A8C7E9B7_NOTPE